MNVILEAASPEKLRSGVLVVGAFADGTLPSARTIDRHRREDCPPSSSGVTWTTKRASRCCSTICRARGRARAAGQPRQARRGRRQGVSRCLGGAAKTLAGGPAEEAAVRSPTRSRPAARWPGASSRRAGCSSTAPIGSTCRARRRRPPAERRARKISLLMADKDKGDPELERGGAPGPGGRRGHGAREGSRQPGRQRLHPGLSRRDRASARQGVQVRRRGAGACRHGEARHGRRRWRSGRASYSRASSSSCTTGAAREAAADRAGRQGHHLRHRRHLAQAGRRPGRDEVRHGRRRAACSAR